MQTWVEADRRNAHWVDIRDDGGTTICADPHFYSTSRTPEQVSAVLTPFSQGRTLFFDY